MSYLFVIDHFFFSNKQTFPWIHFAILAEKQVRSSLAVSSGFPAQRASNTELWWFLCCLPRVPIEGAVEWSMKLHNSHIPECTCPIPHNAPFRTEMCTFLFWMEHFGIWHDDVIKWKHFPHYWPFVQGIHQSPVNSLHKAQWHGALMFSLICAWINGWVNNGEAGDLKHHHAHCDVTVMEQGICEIGLMWLMSWWSCDHGHVTLTVGQYRHMAIKMGDYCSCFYDAAHFLILCSIEEKWQKYVGCGAIVFYVIFFSSCFLTHWVLVTCQ